MLPIELLLEKVRALATKYGLALDQDAFNLALASQRTNFPMILAELFPEIATGHFLEQGKSPASYYPQLFGEYVATTQGEFELEELDFDSDDDWQSMLISFEFKGEPVEILVECIDNSDWFTPDFVVALNQFALKHLTGCWVDFYDDCDWCTSLYVPLAAAAEFQALQPENDEGL